MEKKLYDPIYHPDKSSMTIPNQSLTVKDILERFVRGQEVPVFNRSNDDPQDLSEEDHMQLHQCEDNFERMQTLIDIEEGRIFNDPPKRSSSSRSVKQAETSDSEVVERSASLESESEAASSENAEH